MGGRKSVTRGFLADCPPVLADCPPGTLGCPAPGVTLPLAASFTNLGNSCPLILTLALCFSKHCKPIPSLMLGRLEFKYAPLAYLSFSSSRSFFFCCAAPTKDVILTFKISINFTLVAQASTSISLHLRHGCAMEG
jgi:hypothetical protein